MKKNRLIPFRWLPGSYGLSGQIFKEAEASYYLKPGEELDRELAKIRYQDDNPSEYNRRLVEIEHKYGHIDAYTRDLKLANLETRENALELERKKIEIEFKHGRISELERDTNLLRLTDDLTPEAEIELSFKHNVIDQYKRDVKLAKLLSDEEREVALLEVEYKHGKIKKNTFDKKKATILKEPWIGIVDQGFDPKKGIDGVFFEFDWNNFWIEYLTLNGYVGSTEDEIVESWFSDVCNNTTVNEEMKVQTEDEDF